MPDFRITVHMHHFYGDHRSSCRLFITSKIKIIEDLQEHISNLFDLRADFHLISNNLYLPNREDIRVLKEDDIVIVIPGNQRCFTNGICSSKSEATLEFQKASADKASKRSRGIESESESFDFQGLGGLKKRKKRKNFEPEAVSCTDTDANNVESISNARKKEKKNKKLTNYLLDELLPSPNVTKEKLYTNDSFNENEKQMIKPFTTNNIEEACDDVFEKAKKIKKKSNLYETSKNNSESHSVTDNNFRQPFIVPRKNIKLMEISTKPKVVKSICVRDTPVAVNYVKNEKCVSTVNASSDDIYKENHVTAMETNYDKNIPFSIGINHENNKRNEQLCPIKYSSNENKINKIIPRPLPLLHNKIAPNQKIENINASFLLESNNTTVNNESINAPENVKIISVETFNPALNQTNNEQLLKNETIGPQLIPVLQSTSTLLPNTSEEYPTSEIISHPVLHNITQSNPLDDEGECAAGSQYPCVTTPAESVVSTVTEESGVDLSLPFETKRKRKRVRKRKSKAKTQENVYVTPVVHPKPVYTAAAPTMHIRFDNGNDQNEEMACEDSGDVIDIDLNYDQMCKEEILKYPVMKEKLPKQDDVIAFKICKLSDCYTPEISDIIIAKVLSYCSTTKNVFVKILEGADQCYTPEGKFYMESGDNEDEEEEKSFSWGDLMEPRLLFP